MTYFWQVKNSLPITSLTLWERTMTRYVDHSGVFIHYSVFRFSVNIDINLISLSVFLKNPRWGTEYLCSLQLFLHPIVHYILKLTRNRQSPYFLTVIFQALYFHSLLQIGTSDIHLGIFVCINGWTRMDKNCKECRPDGLDHWSCQGMRWIKSAWAKDPSVCMRLSPGRRHAGELGETPVSGYSPCKWT